MKILSSDFIKTADILNASELITATGHPITNVQDERLSRNAWIIPAALLSLYGGRMYGQELYLNFTGTNALVIDFDLLQSAAFDTFGLAGNNFGRIQIDLAWSQTDIDVPDGTASYTYEGTEWSVIIPTGAQTARYLRVTLTDLQQTGNYLLIGRMSLGMATVIPDLGTTYDTDYISDSNKSFSDSRQVYGGSKVIYRRVNVTFPVIDDPQELIVPFKEVDVFNPFFAWFDEDCLTTEPPIYGVLADSNLPLSYTDGGFYISRISIEEVF